MRGARDELSAERARTLRQDMSPPERVLWKILRGHRLMGWKFTRQVPVPPFVLDFAARRERLGIELDGDSHAGQLPYDEQRTRYLEERGWRIIRFTNSDVVSNPEGVARSILQSLEQGRSSSRRGEDA